MQAYKIYARRIHAKISSEILYSFAREAIRAALFTDRHAGLA